MSFTGTDFKFDIFKCGVPDAVALLRAFLTIQLESTTPPLPRDMIKMIAHALIHLGDLTGTHRALSSFLVAKADLHSPTAETMAEPMFRYAVKCCHDVFKMIQNKEVIFNKAKAALETMFSIGAPEVDYLKQQFERTLEGIAFHRLGPDSQWNALCSLLHITTEVNATLRAFGHLHDEASLGVNKFDVQSRRSHFA